jgi:hypothetical protein
VRANPESPGSSRLALAGPRARSPRGGQRRSSAVGGGAGNPRRARVLAQRRRAGVAVRRGSGPLLRAPPGRRLPNSRVLASSARRRPGIQLRSRSAGRGVHHPWRRSERPAGASSAGKAPGRPRRDLARGRVTATSRPSGGLPKWHGPAGPGGRCIGGALPRPGASEDYSVQLARFPGATGPWRGVKGPSRVAQAAEMGLPSPVLQKRAGGAPGPTSGCADRTGQEACCWPWGRWSSAGVAGPHPGVLGGASAPIRGRAPVRALLRARCERLSHPRPWAQVQSHKYFRPTGAIPGNKLPGQFGSRQARSHAAIQGPRRAGPQRAALTHRLPAAW